MTEVLIILLLILLNGIFAMSEIAMIASRKSALETAAKKGDITAKKALELSRNPGKFLSTVQIGITLIGILMGIYSGDKIEDDLIEYFNRFEFLNLYSEELAVTSIVIPLTFFALVLGELVPKRIGLTMPEPIIKVLSYPMYFISIIAAPFIWLLTFTSDLFIKMFNIKNSSGTPITEEEIKAIIQEATMSGAVQEIEQDIVENVFHLGDRKIDTLITQRHEIEWINLNDLPEANKSKIADSQHKSFLVCKGELDKVIGILHSKEMLNAILKSKPFDLEKDLKPPLYFTKNTSAYQALERFTKTNDHLAILKDESGCIQGLLTLNDLIDALVRDLVDQLHEKKEIIPRMDGSFIVDASLTVYEFARYFKIDIAEDKSISKLTSVEDLVYHFGSKSINTGYRFVWKNLAIEIIDIDGKRVDKVLVTVLTS